MAFSLSRSQYQQLLNWAEQAAPEECCGLLLCGASGEVTAKLTRNVSASPLRHFEIDPQALIAAEKAARSAGPRIAGYFHSHPNGRAEPSRCDANMATADGRIWLIIAGQAITGWRFEVDAGFSPVEIEIEN